MTSQRPPGEVGLELRPDIVGGEPRGPDEAGLPANDGPGERATSSKSPPVLRAETGKDAVIPSSPASPRLPSEEERQLVFRTERELSFENTFANKSSRLAKSLSYDQYIC